MEKKKVSKKENNGETGLEVKEKNQLKLLF